MKAQYINPFLESASLVISQVCNVSPTRGELSIKDVKFYDEHIWIKIGMTGQLQGDIVFGLHKEVALRIVSAMMGGFPIAEMDEIGKSAISELGNMISGNASTLLFNQGVAIDITPPQLVEDIEHFKAEGKALTVPLEIGDLGKLEIQVLVL
ncbi:chemotaxis protein CheX [Brevibacillus dissolubilis]|uniref:chemotaxis protein CheX n=1 Tax=Brevibacillus dissolubilis TaxID=1844116 RepID=UPI001116E12B|nr:chemotaxis protein CheX [Brevibacillus dissolubilis]